MVIYRQKEELICQMVSLIRREYFLLEEVNANNYSPIDGFGEGGRAVQLMPREEVEADKTFGINQVHSDTDSIAN